MARAGDRRHVALAGAALGGRPRRPPAAAATCGRGSGRLWVAAEAAREGPSGGRSRAVRRPPSRRDPRRGYPRLLRRRALVRRPPRRELPREPPRELPRLELRLELRLERLLADRLEVRPRADRAVVRPDVRREPERFRVERRRPLGEGGTFSPLRRASARPIAIACFGSVTRPPRPRFERRNVPRFSRRIAWWTVSCAARLYLRCPDRPPDRAPDFRVDALRAAIVSLLKRWGDRPIIRSRNARLIPSRRRSAFRRARAPL